MTVETVKMKQIGNRSSKKRMTITIDSKLVDDFKKIATANNKKLSPVVEDLIKIYVQQEQGLI